jgi:hypothetical protein
VSRDFEKNYENFYDFDTKVKISKNYIVVDIFKIPYCAGKLSILQCVGI